MMSLFASSVATNSDIIHMIVLGAIMAATYACIAFEWLPKSLAALVGAIFAAGYAKLVGLFPNYHAIHDIIGHDLGVIGVIVGTSILVEIVSRSGLFHFLAVKIVKQTKGDPAKLFLFITLATMLFVTLLTIAPGTMIMVSLVLVVTKELDLDPKPFIVVVALTANSAAMVTFASGICTLMLGTAGNLPYVHFFIVSTPMAILSAGVAYWWVKRSYRDSLIARGDPEERARKVAMFDEWALVKDRRLFYRCAMILGGTIIGFATAQPIGVGPDFIAFCGASAALLLSGIYPDDAIKKVNWGVVLFFVGLFVIIGSVKVSGLLTALANGIGVLAGGDPIVTIILIATFVLVLSGLVDNIPVAATLIPMVPVLSGGNAEQATALWWTLVIASNLGGNSTPVGSISSVIALNALEKERKIKVGWGEFFRVGTVVTLLQGALVLVYLYVFARFDLFP